MYSATALRDMQHPSSITRAGHRAESCGAYDGVVSRTALKNLEPACVRCPVHDRSICGALHGTELAALGDLRHTIRLARGAILLSQGQPANFVHIVTEGGVRLYKIMPDGRRQIVGFALPGDFLGLAIDDRNAYSAETLASTSVCRLSRKAFAELVDRTPELVRRLHSVMAHELSIAQDHMMLLGQYSARQKVAAFILQVRNRWRLNASSVYVRLPMSREDIGDYLGLSMETVSRTLGRLARQKVIVVVPDGVRILDVDGLTTIAGEGAASGAE